MYRKIDRANIDPRVDTNELRSQANHFLRHHVFYTELRNAFRKGRNTKQQLLTLRGQLEAGDVSGAMNGFGELLYRSACREG